MSSCRIEVRSINGPGAAAVAAGTAARDAGLAQVDRCEIVRVYQLDRRPDQAVIDRLLGVVADGVVEVAELVDASAPAPPGTVEVGFLPGVTDAEARALEAVAAGFGAPELRAATVRSYRFGASGGEPLDASGTGPAADADAAAFGRLARSALANATIERWAIGYLSPPFGAEPPETDRVDVVAVRGLDDAGLAELSRTRLLSLDRDELAAIRAFFDDAGRDPTDAELETLAQTWSEHCAHKTFKAVIDFEWFAADGTLRERRRIDGLLASYLRAATETVDRPWVRSAFVDNAGIVAFDDGVDLAIKVETHNHPSALEPFGGANTGVGGVVRDVIGVSARPVACLDVLCFAPPDTPAAAVPEGVLHPRRVAEGVVAGIGDYGNKLGLPTLAGAVVYDEGYLGNPLVYCGAVGVLPRGSHPTKPRVGDRIVVVGGRTGRDGIHGATFSSAELDHTTGEVAGTAVQIGDPITEKGVMELVEAARDCGLYTAITDCGAGGLSSAVGELAAELGVEVDLALVPRKYAGLAPWEVWLSEAQERMVLAVPPEHVHALSNLGRRWTVEVTDIGALTGDSRLRVRHGDVGVVDLPMAFLHGGCPRRTMTARWQDHPDAAEPSPNGPANRPETEAALLALLAHPTIASKADIVRTYDHEVRGGTLVRPWCGPEADGPSDGVAFVPLGNWDSGRAVALGLGINPRYGRLDPYRMAWAVVDEAFRNLVAVGADPDRVAILDNFCWGNPTLPDRLGALVRAAEGCHDAAVAYRAPFVSGKDSLYNEFDGRPIPPTLLVTGLGVVPDRRRLLGAAPRPDGGALYLVGDTRDELGGSMLAAVTGREGGAVPGPFSSEPLERYRTVHRAVRAGLVVAAHDVSEGGLAVALAELAIAGRVGVEADLTAADEGLATAAGLFSESTGRLIVQAAAGSEADLEAALAPVPARRLGRVAPGADRLVIDVDGRRLVDLPVAALVDAFT